MYVRVCASERHRNPRTVDCRPKPDSKEGEKHQKSTGNFIQEQVHTSTLIDWQTEAALCA